MTLIDYLICGWDWNPWVIAALAAAGIAYGAIIRRRGRPWLFAAALALVAFAFLSPLNLLAEGVLFSAHMAQHIILLLLVPALVLLSFPPAFRLRSIFRAHPTESIADDTKNDRDERPSAQARAVLTWFLGVGSMWFWHVPQLCNAAAANPAVHATQTISLLALGSAFWWPILAPNPTARLNPGFGILYLFTACLACTGLGILLTVTPVEVCPIFAAPSSAPSMWVALRERLTASRDQQIGGLLMWMPMCLVYVAAIVLELVRWMGEPRRQIHASTTEVSPFENPPLSP